MTTGAASVTEPRVLPRTLAGSTVLQVVTSLRDTPKARAAVNVAYALVQVGARAIVAGERGELIEELESFGGEWLPFAATAFTPRRRRTDATALEKLSAAERVDIIHARTTSAARTATIATGRNGIHLVTELPDLPRVRMRLAVFSLGALGRGDRIISHSIFNARPMLARCRIPSERVSVIPPSLDLNHFDPASVPPDRVTQLRQAWGIPHGTRIAVVPGAIAPQNGHLTLVGAARILAADGMQGVTFVLAGDDQHHRRFARKFWKRARAGGVDALFRMVGHHTDMAAAYAAADMVVVPYIAAPLDGHLVAEAQAMARPVIASAVGALPENLLAPPRIADELRTGWEVPPGDTAELARAIAAALALDGDAQRAHAARARQFAEYMFSPQRATAATLEVYASLLDSGE
jgi:glycosyltransferase involved in cell wall biosynthesis